MVHVGINNIHMYQTSFLDKSMTVKFYIEQGPMLYRLLARQRRCESIEKFTTVVELTVGAKHHSQTTYLIFSPQTKAAATSCKPNFWKHLCLQLGNNRQGEGGQMLL